MKEKKFSDLLKEKRFDLGLTQDQMRKVLDMSLRMLQGYESGAYDDKPGIRREKYLRKLAVLSNESIQGVFNTTNVVKESPAQYSQNANITFVPLKAYGGFLYGYANKIFMDSLEHFTLPGVYGEHYAFEIDGMSMYLRGDDLSAKPGDRAITTPVESLKDMLKNKGYIIVSVEGICYKIFDRIDDKKAYFHSLNSDYDGLDLPLKSIKKIYFVDWILKKL